MTQIVGCGRTVAGGYVAYDIQYDEQPTGRVVQWSMEVRSSDDADVVRLVHERIEGRSAGQFVEDTGSGRRVVVSQDADLREREITVRFTLDVVGVAVEWPVWRAVLTVDGEDLSAMAVPSH